KSPKTVVEESALRGGCPAAVEWFAQWPRCRFSFECEDHIVSQRRGAVKQIRVHFGKSFSPRSRAPQSFAKLVVIRAPGDMVRLATLRRSVEAVPTLRRSVANRTTGIFACVRSGYGPLRRGSPAGRARLPVGNVTLGPTAQRGGPFDPKANAGSTYG